MLTTSYGSKERVRALQRKLYRKAKQEPEFRFYSLYDKIYRKDVLQTAYELVKQNKGSPGLDGITFGKIEQEKGKQDYLLALQEALMLIDYLCAKSGGQIYYTGRDMKLSHKGMNISESDWEIFFGHAGATMQTLSVPQQECDDVVAFVSSLKYDIVELS